MKRIEEQCDLRNVQLKRREEKCDLPRRILNLRQERQYRERHSRLDHSFMRGLYLCGRIEQRF
jgi:hypothetical protein